MDGSTCWDTELCEDSNVNVLDSEIAEGHLQPAITTVLDVIGADLERPGRREMLLGFQ